jgi:hypothetical protein
MKEKKQVHQKDGQQTMMMMIMTATMMITKRQADSIDAGRQHRGRPAV